MNRSYYILLFIFTYLISAKVSSQDISADHLPKTIIIKVKPAYRNLCEINQINDLILNSFFDQIGIEKLEKKFPNHRPPGQLMNIDGELYADLSTIYELTYKNDFQLIKVIRYLNNLPKIAYAEPHYIPKPLFTPNDSALSYHLGLIQAYAAWDSTYGDTNIVIGITDSGTDTNHIDLQGSVKYNYADPIDGIDNDFDGFIDNYRGWDLGENDNDPSATSVQYHGIYVTGLASAVTNNGKGIAGIGFNCKYLPVKVSNSAGSFTAAYEGIVYAVDHGCQIVNCSWGGVYKPSQFEQEIINYASINKNALVIAAAGNSGDESIYNPASLKHVLSVGGTGTNDVKTSNSTYGINLDLSAPGISTISTNDNSNYITFSNPGTSWAAPIVSGCAAIVKTIFPNYSSIQIGEQLKVTCDNIDTIAGNSAYIGKLGTGRVNLYRAITETDKPSIIMIRNVITDGNDDKFEIGETINIGATFKNYLDTTNNLFVTLSSNNPNITILNNTSFFGAINTLDTANNYATPFSFTIEATAKYNEVVELIFSYSDGTYNAVEHIDIVVNSDMVDINTNDISSTITSNSRLGYNDPKFLDPKLGLGFSYKEEQLLYEAGFMVGAAKKDTIYVSDNVLDGLSPDSDFVNISIATALTPSIVSDFDVAVSMNDNNADSNMMMIGLEQNVYVWNNVANDNFIITEYEIINNDTITMDNVYAGIFADWDIRDYSANRASEELFNKVGYATCTETGSPFVGIKLLTNGPFNHYAIDNYSGAPGVDIFSSNFTTSKKYTTLSTQRSDAGLVGNGNDVCDVVSTGPFTLLPADTLLVAFALIAGDDFMDLLLAAQVAQTQYDSIYYVEDTTTSHIDKQANNKINVYPNPANNTVSLLIGSEYGNNITIQLYNNMGVQVYSGNLKNGHKRKIKTLDTSTLESGLYHYIISSNNLNTQGKLMIVH